MMDQKLVDKIMHMLEKYALIRIEHLFFISSSPTLLLVKPNHQDLPHRMHFPYSIKKLPAIQP